MKPQADWWTRKKKLTTKYLSLLAACLVLASAICLIYPDFLLIGIPLVYWMFAIILPMVCVFILSRFYREDASLDRRANHTGIE